MPTLSFVLLIIFTHRWLHKSLVTKESITNPTYLTRLSYSLTFEKKRKEKKIIIITFLNSTMILNICINTDMNSI